MLDYERIHVLEGIDANKSPNKSKEYDIIGISLINHQSYLCNGCHDMMMKAVTFNDVAVVSVKGNSYRIQFSFMSKNDAINLLNNSVLSNKGVL